MKDLSIMILNEISPMTVLGAGGGSILDRPLV